MPTTPSLTPELLALLGFVVWAILLVTCVGIWRAAQVLMGQKRANEFPSGTPHGGDLYWRLNRAHVNTAENLPVFASLVVIAHLAGIRSEATALLAQTIVVARVIQSLIHIASGSAMAVNLRFTAFLVQIGCFFAFAWILVTSVA